MVGKHKQDVVIFVEGATDRGDDLRTECRKAFSDFFSKTKLGNRLRPRVIPCGGRNNAYNDFCTALRQNKNALLLVDSEAAIDSAHQKGDPADFLPWSHVKARDGWNTPADAEEAHCHLMVECMENWFIADWNTVADFFGKGFENKHKPAGAIANLAKPRVYVALEAATKFCNPKEAYGKGPHSFKLLGLIDAGKVLAQSPWAQRLIDEIEKRKS